MIALLLALALSSSTSPPSPSHERAPSRPLPAMLRVAPRLFDPAHVDLDRPTVGPTVVRPTVVYLNRHGGTYACAAVDDASTRASSVACGAPDNVARMGAFAGSEAQWQTVLGCVQNLYAPFHIAITDEEPGEAPYIEAVIGGSPAQAGQPDGVAGIAPFSCALEPGAVVYDFADAWGNDLQSICETAGQEVAHAFGLDHELLCGDPMSYLTGCGAKTFKDTWASCGEFEPRACACGDATQNSVQSMLALFGSADGSVPPVVDGSGAPEDPAATASAPTLREAAAPPEGPGGCGAVRGDGANGALLLLALTPALRRRARQPSSSSGPTASSGNARPRSRRSPR